VVGPQTARNGVVAIDPRTIRSDVARGHSLAGTNDALSRFGLMASCGVRGSTESDQKAECQDRPVHSLSTPGARFIPGVIHRTIPGFFTALPREPHGKCTGFSEQSSTGFSTGCPLTCQPVVHVIARAATVPRFARPRWHRPGMTALLLQIVRNYRTDSTNLPDGQITSDFQKSCQAPKSKIFPFVADPNQMHIQTVPAHTEGRCARHETRGGMRWTRRRQASNSEPDE
jgi:hypothetical protein